MQGKGPYPFAAKASQYREFSDAALAWSVRDAAEARDICGKIDASTFGWYADDVSTILAEIKRRAGRK